MTLVVVAVDDFALRVESDAPEAPAFLLLTAERVQTEMRAREPEIQAALADLLIYGRGVVPFPSS